MKDIKLTFVSTVQTTVEASVTDNELDILLSITDDFDAWTPEQLSTFNKYRGHIVNEITLKPTIFEILEDIDDSDVEDINIIKQI